VWLNGRCSDKKQIITLRIRESKWGQIIGLQNHPQTSKGSKVNIFESLGNNLGLRQLLKDVE
jgi:hypothetical protein